MISIIFGLCLATSILVIIYMTQKKYENFEINFWTIMILFPLVLLGYWLKTRIHPEAQEEAIVCYCIMQLENSVLLTAVIFSLLNQLNIKVARWIKGAAFTIAFLYLGCFWLGAQKGLFISNIEIIDTGMGMSTKITKGPLSPIYYIYLALLFLVIIGILAYGFFKKQTSSKRILLIYSFFSIAAVIVYIIEYFFRLNFSTLPILYVVCDIIIALNYDYAHCHNISFLISEQQNQYGTRGFAAFDLNGNFLSCNSQIFDYLPSLANQRVDENIPEDNEMLNELFTSLISDYENEGITSRKFKYNNIMCACEISPFSLIKTGKKQGYLFDIRDVTAEQKVVDVIQEYNSTLNREVAEKTEHILSIQQKVVLGLANMVENRDNNTGGHVKRTSDIIQILVDEILNQKIASISDEKAKDIVRAAPMHDLGKISIDTSILCKPDKLTPAEYAVMRTHSSKSGEIVKIILQDVEEQHFVDTAFNVARYHHERWDGRGYPEGLVGEMIPIEARIMAVADVYDALVSERCYKLPMNFEEAARIMCQGMGSQFDPTMKPVFIACRSRLEEYYTKSNSPE